MRFDPDDIGINSLIFKLLIVENMYTFTGVNTIPLDATGLVKVTGVNLDSKDPSSNGAGKSTVWKCMLKLFYGRKALKREKPSDAYDTELNNNRIECHFHKDGHNYIARETKKHADYPDGLHVFCDGKPWGVKNDQEMLRRELQAVLNRSYEEFVGTIIWKQNNDHALIDGTPAERAKWISDFFGLSIYDELFDEFKSKHNTAKEKITSLADVKAKAELLKNSMDSVGDIEKSKRRIVKFMAKLKECEALIKTSDTRIDALKSKEQDLKRLAELKAEIDSEPSVDLNKLQKKIETSKASIATMRKQLELAGSAKTVVDDYRKLKSRKDELLSKITAISKTLLPKQSDCCDPSVVSTALRNEVKQLSETEQALNNARMHKEAYSKVSEAMQELDELTFTKFSAKYLKSMIETHSTHIREYEKTITKSEMIVERQELLDEHIAKCPTCGSTVDVDRLRTEVECARSAITESESFLKSARKERKLFERGLELRRLVDSTQLPKKSTASFAELKAQVVEINKRIESLETLSDMVQRYQRYVSDLKSMKPKFLECKSALDADEKWINAEIKTLEAGLDSMVLLRDKLSRYASLAERFGVIDSVQGKMSSLRRQIINHEETKVESQETIQDLSIRVDRLKQAVSTYDQYLKDYNALSDDLAALSKWTRLERIYNVLKKAYDKQGLKTARLRELVDAIKTRLPVWTSLLFTEKNFSIDATGNEKKIGFEVTQTREVVSNNKKRKIVKRFDACEASGSERTRISCALMLTMSDVASSEKSCNLLVLDELERGLDKQSRQIMSEEVIPLLKHKKPSLFLITHSLEIDQGVFDHDLIITKKNQQSSTRFAVPKLNRKQGS